MSAASDRIAPMSATQCAIRIWKKAYKENVTAAIGYPSRNILWRMMYGISGGVERWLEREKSESIALAVTNAISYMRWLHEDGQCPNMHDPFLACHIHVIRGDYAINQTTGRPMSAEHKARILGMSVRTYYRRIEMATDFIHNYLGDGG